MAASSATMGSASLFPLPGPMVRIKFFGPKPLCLGGDSKPLFLLLGCLA